MIKGFYFITDRKLSVNGIFNDVIMALENGAGVVQYREKSLSTRKMYEEGRRIRKFCEDYGAIYIVNDRIDIALATDADGVHIGQDDMPLEAAREIMPGGIIGVSCSSLREAEEAVKGGADYLGVGPIYPTTTKDDAGRAIGIEGLREIRARVEIPIVAIGGITLERLTEVVGAGADSVAAISATVGHETGMCVGRFVKELKRWGGEE